MFWMIFKIVCEQQVSAHQQLTNYQLDAVDCRAYFQIIQLPKDNQFTSMAISKAHTPFPTKPFSRY